MRVRISFSPEQLKALHPDTIRGVEFAALVAQASLVAPFAEEGSHDVAIVRCGERLMAEAEFVDVAPDDRLVRYSDVVETIRNVPDPRDP